MSRRPLLVLLAIPLMIGGSLAAHVLSYRLAVPDATERARLLARTGHHYLDSGPLLLGVLTAVALVGFVLQTVEASRGNPSNRVCGAAFFSLPLIGFAVQEYVERYAHSGHFPIAAALEPTFLIGLALQVPFGLLALAAYRLLTRAAERLGGALRADSEPVSDARARSIVRCPGGIHSVRLRVIAFRLAERGPPCSPVAAR